jgi:AraC-like DNA-binding protein
MSGMDASKSGLTGWVLAIVRAMKACDINVERVLTDIGMDPILLEGGYSRYSQEQISQLWLKAIELSGDQNFGLRVVAEIRPATFHVVGYAMSCSATLARALHRFAFYCRLISDSATATITEAGETTILEFLFDTGGKPLIYQTIDTILAGTLSFSRWIIDEQIEPFEVRLQHAPPANDAAYCAFFRCPIQYNSSQNCILFRKADLERPIMAADEELASLLDSVANRYLEKRMSGRTAVRVRDILIASLSNGAVSKADAARQLNMTERTLLRRLKAEGTTFVDVLNGVRQELAFQYLQRPGVTVVDVAYMLGFSDENTFSRAFKRWTGRRPGMLVPSRSKRPADEATAAAA